MVGAIELVAGHFGYELGGTRQGFVKIPASSAVSPLFDAHPHAAGKTTVKLGTMVTFNKGYKVGVLSITQGKADKFGATENVSIKITASKKRALDFQSMYDLFSFSDKYGNELSNGDSTTPDILTNAEPIKAGETIIYHVNYPSYGGAPYFLKYGNVKWGNVK
ncbi:hypothetical protein [Lactococcus nasutitermitis]